MPTHLVFADSDNRNVSLYPTGDSYTLHLMEPLKNVERVDLVSARVPNTMYNLTENTNAIFIGSGGTLSNPSTNLPLNQGFYSAYNLAAALTALGTVTVTYLSQEGHYLFSWTSQFAIKINQPQLATMLGMASGVILTSGLAGPTDPSYANQYILRSSTLVDFSLNDYIFLDIDELRTPSHMDTGAIQTGSKGTISGMNAGRSFAPIIMDTGSACIKNFHENKDYKVSVFYPEPIGRLQRLTVRWVDKTGSQLNFQGWNTNAFILRIHIREDETQRQLPPPPPLQDVEIKRIIDAMTIALPPPEPKEKKRKIPWWLLFLAAVAAIIAYKSWPKPALPHIPVTGGH
jgi:hypothetical protein